MAPDQLVSQNLERWKEHLLDTSKRNRLLYFKPDAAIQLVEPSLDLLWERLVKRPKAQSFFGLEAEIDLFNDEESDEDDLAAPPHRALKSDEMRATPGGPKLSRLLYGLRSKSNLSLEEQGLTTLYVAWGFLKWRDAKSGEEISSPLVLAPMTLLRESSRAFYRLKLSEEDLWLNPVLEWKLATDYKIALPELPAFEDADPFAYFDQVRAAVRKQSGWSVWEAAYLGLFSFHKMAMYQDLRDGQEKALANPFVRALGGDASQLPVVPKKLPRAHNLDEIAVLDSFGVLDCDSSQGEAVEAAKAGVSFVLQGPPGTGKSQTISNIIAGCLASGKRVLFVSEKMAALDVVHERLRSAGLDLFCLKAHSQGASKKEVIADLGKTLAAARTGAQAASLQSASRQDGAEAGELERLRAGLNAYARELHKPRSALNLSVYEAAGELALRSEAPEIAAPLPNPFSVDGARLSQWRETLKSASRMSEVWQAGENHVWHGVKTRPFSLDLGATIRARAARAAALCDAVSQGAWQLAPQCGVTGEAFSLLQSEELPRLWGLLCELEGANHRPPAMWFVLEDLEPNFALAREFQGRFAEVKSRRAALDARYGSEFWDLPHADLIDRAKARHQNTLSRAGTWEKFPDWQRETLTLLERIGGSIQTEQKRGLCATTLKNAQELARIGGLKNADFSIIQVEALLGLAALVAQLQNLATPPTQWLSLDELDSRFAIAREFKHRFEAIAGRRQSLGNRYQTPFWDLPHSEVLERMTTRHQATLLRSGTWEKFADWGEETRTRLEKMAARLETANAANEVIARALGLSAPITLSATGRFAYALAVFEAEFVKQERHVAARWFDSSQMLLLRAECERCKAQAAERDEAVAKLGDYDLHAMQSVDLAALKGRFETNYASFLRPLKSAFRADMKTVNSWRRDGQKAVYGTALKDLQVAANWERIRADFAACAQNHGRDFGDSYQGENTNWTKIEDDLAACQRLQGAFAHCGGVPEEFARQLESRGSFDKFANAWPQLYSALQPLREELNWLGVVFSLQNLPFQDDGISLSFASALLQDLIAWLRGHVANLSDVDAAFHAFFEAQKSSEFSPSVFERDAREAIEIARLEDELRAQEGFLEAHFGGLFEKEQTDWQKILSALEWTEQVLKWWKAWPTLSAAVPDGVKPSPQFVQLIADVDGRDQLESFATSCQSELLDLKDSLDWLKPFFSTDDLPALPDGRYQSVSGTPLLHFASWIKVQTNNLRDVALAFGALTELQKVENLLPTQLVADAGEAMAVLEVEAQLRGENARLKTRFATLFAGDETDWDAVLKSLDWTSRAIVWWKNWAKIGGKSGERGQASGDFVALASGEKPFDTAAVSLPTGELREEWKYFSALFERGVTPRKSLSEDKEWFAGRHAVAAEIEDYLRWRVVENSLQGEGLLGFCDEARRLNVSGDSLANSFEKRFWSLWFDAALAEPQSASLRLFVGGQHNNFIELFRTLDLNSLESAQRRLSAILWDKKPVSTTIVARGGEMSILQKEVVKKARLKPLRRLFREIPHLLSALKPCMLMSPLAVAQFLEAERAAFDLVIFDEASQICPEDAIGAIMRAAQVVIVGDRKQLPPSRYFASGGTFDSDDDAEESDDGVFESILDMSAPYLPGFMLLWHYRSRDEALISFSNQHFYDGRLITFPGPHIGGAHGRGVRFEAVDGIYLRGKVPGARSNPREAARVAGLVIEHLERAPNQSLGVIALNAQQARAIDEALGRLIRDRPHLENLINPARREKFFIKALENVQGDERDAIILSIGYGRGKDGKISMNFGPLNREGGERRLNVAVTRARDALTVVSSLQPEHIDPSKTSARGPKLLRAYLEMARRGGDVSNLESSLESEGMVDSIEAALQSRGWKTHRGVGRSALKIDIAVEHPEKAGEFLLGIECDGADYVSAPTARDRNRLRPAVLTGLGWQLDRVWSLDWLRNPAGELDRLDGLLRAAMSPASNLMASENAAPEPALKAQSEIEPSELGAPAPRVDFAPFQILDEDPTESPVADVLLLQIESVDSGATSLALAGSFDLDDKETPTPDSGERLPFYQPAELGILGWQNEFREMSVQNVKLRAAIFQVVKGEGPVAIGVVARRVASAWCFGRVSDSILGKILVSAGGDSRIEERDGFFWPAAMQNPPLRVPKPGEEARRADEICPQEWGEAAIHCLCEAFGMEREELIVQAARLMGFARTGVQVRASVGAGVDLLLQNGRLVERDGALAVAE